MRYGVIGSRTFMDYVFFKETLDRHIISQIISGGAIGADTLAENYARARNIPFKVHLPDYDRYGRKAPFVRNKLIVDDSDIIVAFWDLKSTGTKHSLDYANQKGIKCVVYTFQPQPKEWNIE